MVVGDRAADGGTRYSMLETLRAYARERLDDADDADQWRRQARRALRRLRRASRRGSGRPRRTRLAERVRAELDNVRAAIGWALDSSLTTDAQLGLRIVAALAYDGGHRHDLRGRRVDGARRARVHETTPGRRTAILGAAAIQAIYVGDHERAQTLALDALRDGLPADCPVPAPAYSALASFELNSGRPEEALSVVRRGLEDLENAGGGDTCKLSIFHSLIAVFSTYCGDIATARREADEALRLARQVGNPSASATALWAAGRALAPRRSPPRRLRRTRGTSRWRGAVRRAPISAGRSAT